MVSNTRRLTTYTVMLTASLLAPILLGFTGLGTLVAQHSLFALVLVPLYFAVAVPPGRGRMATLRAGAAAIAVAVGIVMCAVAAYVLRFGQALPPVEGGGALFAGAGYVLTAQVAAVLVARRARPSRTAPAQVRA